MASLPNPEILLNSVTLLEARDSSAIENIDTTSDDLFAPRDVSNVTDHAAKEALRYRATLFSGLESMRKRPLSTNTAIVICSALHGRSIDVRKVCKTGRERTLAQALCPLPRKVQLHHWRGVQGVGAKLYFNTASEQRRSNTNKYGAGRARSATKARVIKLACLTKRQESTEPGHEWQLMPLIRLLRNSFQAKSSFRFGR